MGVGQPPAKVFSLFEGPVTAVGDRKPGRGRKRAEHRSAPEGFHLRNYGPSEQFAAKDWAQQFAKRWFLRLALATSPRDDADLAGRLRQLIADPLCPYAYSYTPQASSLGLAGPPRFAQPTIRPLRVRDFVSVSQLLRDRDATNEHVSLDELAFAHPDWGLGTSRARIEVDLYATDKDLVHAFELWLSGYRAATKQVGVHHHKKLKLEMADWCKNRMLAFTDLTLWGEWRGVSFTNEQMLDILFSDNPDGPTASKLRSSRNDAKRCITLECVHALLLSQDQEGDEAR